MSAEPWGDLHDDGKAAAIGDRALETAAHGADFANVRLVECEELRAYHGSATEPDERVERNLGIGGRVLVDGAWGFASQPPTDPADADRAALRAVEMAAAGVEMATPMVLPDREPASGRYETSVGQDPFAISSAEREVLLERMVRTASAPAGVVGVQSGVNAKRQHRHFGDSSGSRQHQHHLECGAMVVATASGDGDTQRRSYPKSIHGDTGAGWEFVIGLDMEANADRIDREAVQLLAAPVAPSGTADVVVGLQQLSLQIHQSAGHALELDRILGDESNFAGTSFIRPEDVGTLRCGSPAVTIVSDPTVLGTRGSFAFDDEGTPAARRADEAIRCSDADEMEICVLGRAGQYTRFAWDRIHQPQHITEVQILVRALVNGHARRTSTSDAADLDRAAQQASAAARRISRQSTAAGTVTLAEPDGQAAITRWWHDDVLTFDNAARGSLARSTMAAAESAGAIAAGMYGRALTQQVVANSGGVRRAELAMEVSGALTTTVADGTPASAGTIRSWELLSAAPVRSLGMVSQCDAASLRPLSAVRRVGPAGCPPWPDGRAPPVAATGISLIHEGGVVVDLGPACNHAARLSATA